MTNDEFQKAVLRELKCINSRIDGVEKEFKAGQKRIEVRQDEIYQAVTAIEHSNQVGRSELDNQNIRVAKLEGKFKKAGKVFNEDVEIDKASNL
jgi:hypothetical protein